MTDCVIDSSANSRLTGRALIVSDLWKTERASAEGDDGWLCAAVSDIERKGEVGTMGQSRCRE